MNLTRVLGTASVIYYACCCGVFFTGCGRGGVSRRTKNRQNADGKRIYPTNEDEQKFAKINFANVGNFKRIKFSSEIKKNFSDIANQYLSSGGISVSDPPVKLSDGTGGIGFWVVAHYAAVQALCPEVRYNVVFPSPPGPDWITNIETFDLPITDMKRVGNFVDPSEFGDEDLLINVFASYAGIKETPLLHYAEFVMKCCGDATKGRLAVKCNSESFSIEGTLHQEQIIGPLISDKFPDVAAWPIFKALVDPLQFGWETYGRTSNSIHFFLPSLITKQLARVDVESLKRMKGNVFVADSSSNDPLTKTEQVLFAFRNVERGKRNCFKINFLVGHYAEQMVANYSWLARVLYFYIPAKISWQKTDFENYESFFTAQTKRYRSFMVWEVDLCEPDKGKGYIIWNSKMN